jgi:probable HAF family extracellular repeat protein
MLAVPRGVIALAFSLLASLPASAATMFTGLGFVPGGAPGSIAYAISADGSVVVGEGQDASNNPEAFRWTASAGMIGLGDLPGGLFTSSANAVSGDGSVVVGFGNAATGQTGFRWTASTGMVEFTGGDLTGISADGSVMVGNGVVLGAFRWTASGGSVSLGNLPGGFSSAAFGVSLDGSTVVGSALNASSNPEPFRWTAATGMVGLGAAGEARAVSADGSVVVGSADVTGGSAFMWTEAGGMVGLGFDEALAVSADGSVIVGTIGQTEAVFWTSGRGVQSVQDVLVNHGLDLTGWDLSYATGVSADGKTLTGWGARDDGSVEAWIAFLPEPGAGVLVATALLAMWCARAGLRCQRP